MFVSIFSAGQPTFVGVSAVPSDNSTDATSPQAIGVPAGLAAGDLWFVYAAKRTASGAITMTSQGGQTWTSGTATASTGGVLSGNFFWCIYTGSGSNPQITFNATTNNTSISLGFRPATGGDSWAVDAAQSGTFVDRAAAASFTITGWTPNHAKNVNIAVWNTDDDNTWGTLTGTNWTKGTLSAQYRNTAGSDASISIAYQLQNAAAATNNVSQTETALGNDGGLTFAICFYEFTAATRNANSDFFKLFGNINPKQNQYVYGTKIKISK